MSLETRSTVLLFMFAPACALLASLACGCAARDRLQPGLANGPRLGGDAPVVSHDVVANAGDSCPANGEAGDPLPQRFPPCPRVGERAPSVALLSATIYVPPPKWNRWKFHLEGLPPCEDPTSPWVASESGPLCAR